MRLAYLPLMLRLFLISMSSHRAHSGLFPQIPHSPPKSTAIWQHWWDLDSMTLKMVSQVGKKDNGSFQEYLNWVARNYCHLSKFINKILLLMFQCLFLIYIVCCSVKLIIHDIKKYEAIFIIYQQFTVVFSSVEHS